MRRRADVWLGVLLVLCPLLAGSRCAGGTGSGGSPAVLELRSPDRRCVVLADPGLFPPDFDFVPPVAGTGAGAPLQLVAATDMFKNLIPYAIEETPFQMPPGTQDYALPPDSDLDGNIEFFKSIGQVRVVSDSLALVTVSGNIEAVLFIDPSQVGPRAVTVSVPDDFEPERFAAFPGLPPPGASRLQTGITTTACLVPDPSVLDSRGEPLSTAVAPIFWCDDGGAPSYTASFTAGAAVSAGRLFAAVSNVGVDQGAEDTQYLPGAVVVYTFDGDSQPPVVSPATDTADTLPYVLTSGFNPTAVTPYATPAGRELLLVTLSGAIGIRRDDPNTSEIEGGAIRITDGAIDVIDARAVELLATIPLRSANPGFDGLAIDPTGRVAMLGDLNARRLYAIDLSVLSTLPAAGSGGAPRLLEEAVIFDGVNPLVVPALPGGAPAASCPGQIVGVGFSNAGTRAYALETCDGSLAALSVDLSGVPSTAALRDRIRVTDVFPVTAPLRADTDGQFRRPSSLKVRPGRPGIDYVGPDVFFLIGDPEGTLCGIRLDSR